MSDEPRSTPPMEEREFEDLSLAEAVGDLMRQPIGTARRLIAVSAPDKLMRPIRVRRQHKMGRQVFPVLGRSFLLILLPQSHFTYLERYLPLQLFNLP